MIDFRFNSIQSTIYDSRILAILEQTGREVGNRLSMDTWYVEYSPSPSPSPSPPPSPPSPSPSFVGSYLID